MFTVQSTKTNRYLTNIRIFTIEYIFNLSFYAYILCNHIFAKQGNLYLGMCIQNIVFRELEVPLDDRKLFCVRGSFCYVQAQSRQ